MTTFGSRLSTCNRVLQKERLLTYGVISPGQSRGISPLQGGGRSASPPNALVARTALHMSTWRFFVVVVVVAVAVVVVVVVVVVIVVVARNALQMLTWRSFADLEALCCCC